MHACMLMCMCDLPVIYISLTSLLLLLTDRSEGNHPFQGEPVPLNTLVRPALINFDLILTLTTFSLSLFKF